MAWAYVAYGYFYHISYYFQCISWPIASQLQHNEEMELQVMAFNRFLNNRLLGTASLNLQRLLDESSIQLKASLLDINGRPLKVSFPLLGKNKSKAHNEWQLRKCLRPKNIYLLVMMRGS